MAYFKKPNIYVRCIVTLAIAWLCNEIQHVLNQRTCEVGVGGPDRVIRDVLHEWTADMTAWMHREEDGANYVLVAHQLYLDLMAILFVVECLFFCRTLRPVFTMGSFLLLRHLSQFLVHLPCPPDFLWRETPVPTLAVHYEPAADFFMSGHTGTSIILAIEFYRSGRYYLATLASLAVPAMMLLVLVCRVHYTCDIIAAAATSYFCSRMALHFDELLFGPHISKEELLKLEAEVAKTTQ